MLNKLGYLTKIILISPAKFSFICFLLTIEIAVLSFSVLSLVPLADYILDSTLINKSRITLELINILNIWNLKPTFFILSFFFIIFQIFKAFISIFINYAILKFKYDVLKKINNDSLSLVLNSKWNFFSEINYGYLTNTFIKEINNIGQTIGHLAKTFASISQFLVYLIIPIYINPYVTITIISLIIIVAIPLVKFSSPLSYKFGKLNTNTANLMMSSLSQILSSVKFVITNSRSDFFKKIFLEKFDIHVKASLKYQILISCINSFFQPFGILVIVIVFNVFLSTGIILSEITAIFYSLISIVSSANSLIGINLNISNLIPSYIQLNNILKKAQIAQRANGKIFFNKLKKKIIFDKLHFEYKKNQRILNNISFEIKKNSITSIVGKSGSGKSTIVDLILGILEQQKGSILIDDVKLEQFEINSFRKKISYVTQDTVLFNDSIQNNLQLISPKKLKPKEIWEALEYANIKSFIKKLPNQLRTIIGERGVRLSGGQRQRLSLARAFLKKPEILILDEATSSLDTFSENEIYKTIYKIKKKSDITIILIAHRLSTLKNSNKILVIDNGKLIEEGSYNYLKNKKESYFNKMLKAQMKKK